MGFYKENFEKFDKMGCDEYSKWATFSDNIKWIAPLAILLLVAKDGWVVSIGLCIYFVYGMYMQICANTYRACRLKKFQNLSEEEQEKFEL